MAGWRDLRPFYKQGRLRTALTILEACTPRPLKKRHTTASLKPTEMRTKICRLKFKFWSMPQKSCMQFQKVTRTKPQELCKSHVPCFKSCVHQTSEVLQATLTSNFKCRARQILSAVLVKHQKHFIPKAHAKHALHIKNTGQPESCASSSGHWP